MEALRALSNAEIRNAINETCKELKPRVNGFGQTLLGLDDKTKEMLRLHLERLLEEEYARTKTVHISGLGDSVGGIKESSK